MFLCNKNMDEEVCKTSESFNVCSTLFYVMKNKPECTVFFEEKAGAES